MLKSILYRTKDISWGAIAMRLRMFGTDRKTNLLCTGSVFRRVRRDNAVETATVLSIDDDSCGIPHVRYQVSIGRDDNVFDEGPRVLALSSFTEQYLCSSTS